MARNDLNLTQTVFRSQYSIHIFHLQGSFLFSAFSMHVCRLFLPCCALFLRPMHRIKHRYHVRGKRLWITTRGPAAGTAAARPIRIAMSRSRGRPAPRVPRDLEENRGFAANRARWVRAAFGASRAVRVPPDRGALSGRWDREVRRACAVTPGRSARKATAVPSAQRAIPARRDPLAPEASPVKRRTGHPRRERRHRRNAGHHRRRGHPTELQAALPNQRAGVDDA